MYFLGVWVWQRLTVLIKTLVRFLSVLTKKQSWAFSSILVESSLSKNPAKSIQLKPPTLVFDQIWTWYLIKFLIPCPGLPSARVQLSPSSKIPLFRDVFLVIFHLLTPTLLPGYNSPLVLDGVRVEPNLSLQDPAAMFPVSIMILLPPPLNKVFHKVFYKCHECFSF